MNKKIIRTNLEHLGLSSTEIQVYISLTELGESSIHAISKKSELARTTVKSILDRLSEKGYITIHKYNNVNHYWIESPETLKASFENKIELTNNLAHVLEDLYRSSSSNIPFAQVYDTQSSIRNFIEKTITGMKKGSSILTIDAPKEKNYNKFFSKEYFENLLLLKKKKNILTQTLIPYGQFSGISNNILQKQEIQIREMPQSINFQASIWIIEDRLILFSGENPFIIEVKNSIIVESFKSIVGFVWESSVHKY